MSHPNTQTTVMELKSRGPESRFIPQGRSDRYESSRRYINAPEQLIAQDRLSHLVHEQDPGPGTDDNRAGNPAPDPRLVIIMNDQ